MANLFLERGVQDLQIKTRRSPIMSLSYYSSGPAKLSAICGHDTLHLSPHPPFGVEMRGFYRLVSSLFFSAQANQEIPDSARSCCCCFAIAVSNLE
ncbi:hypothetical protein TNIN_481521 [Trichonephila inaurata madagascariensis]|uniref:Uncharacterized protein n=1 Tax=Trichonephila inaurata madagascariensis TaxID=2747483 RepID=A0A8X7BRH9_9ARAC|nr:hypothetical protein TNIN_481521 [Trichonephila inaurata madagascariensis]